jgi:hypothetical protein
MSVLEGWDYRDLKNAVERVVGMITTGYSLEREESARKWRDRGARQWVHSSHLGNFEKILILAFFSKLVKL